MPFVPSGQHFCKIATLKLSLVIPAKLVPAKAGSRNLYAIPSTLFCVLLIEIPAIFLLFLRRQESILNIRISNLFRISCFEFLIESSLCLRGQNRRNFY